MFIVNSNGTDAVVPGYLLGYHGDAMMPEYSRYMATLPIFALANLASASMSAYAVLADANHFAFIAFAAYMAIFSAKMFTRRLVRVKFAGTHETATSAPLLARFETLLSAGNLAAIGAAFLRLNGEFDTTFFHIFGVSMIGLAAATALAFHRGGARRKK